MFLSTAAGLDSMLESTVIDESVTTLMIRNLPRKFTAWDLVAELEFYMPRSSFDFVYVPWDKKNSNNVGYGFVNFVDVDSSAHARASLDGREWRTGARARVIRLLPALMQGLQENLCRFVEAREHRDEGHVPLVFLGGVLVSVDMAMRSPSVAEGPSAGARRRGGPKSERSSGRQSTCGSLGSVFHESFSSDASSSGEDAPDAPRTGGGTQAMMQLRQTPQHESLFEPMTLLAGMRPPPGLPVSALTIVKSSAGYAAAWQDVDSLLRRLTAALPTARAAARHSC